MDKKDFELRSYNFEIRAEDSDNGSGVIIGRPIVYEKVTDLGMYDEVIQRGALKNTDLTDVRFLVNHDISKIPLARSRNNNENSTMQLFVDEKGLGIKVKLDIANNSDARNLYSAVKRGDISGMSFMFIVEKDKWEDLDTDHPKRTILSISTVIEVSAVTFPAYEDTSISARNKNEALESATQALESARRSLESESKNQIEVLRLRAEILSKF